MSVTRGAALGLTFVVPALLSAGSSALAGDSGAAACQAAYEDAQLLRRSGKLIEAREAALVCSRPSCPEVARRDCAGWAGEIQREVPSVVVVAQDEYYVDEHGARVFVDGSERAEAASGRAFELDPGEHVFRLERPGYEPMERAIVIVQGERDRILRFPLRALAPPPPAPAPPHASPPQERPILHERRTYLPAILAASGTAAAFGVSAWLGLTGRSDLSDLRSTCAPACTDAQVDPVRRKLVASDIVLGVGLVGAVVSAFFFFRPPQIGPAAPPTIGVILVPGGASLSLGAAL